MSLLLSAFPFAKIPEHTAGLRKQVNAFLAEHLGSVSVDVRARSWLGFDAAFSAKLAARGWVGAALPGEYGGAELDALSRFVLIEELLTSGAPVAAHWIAERQSGPLIHKFGNDAQRAFYLPKICAAEAFFCIGMSEPGSGSDLASVSSRATRVQDGWRLNGRKVWTTHAHQSHYMIALVRSSGDPKDRQKGLSQFIVDLSLPGVTITPIYDLTGDAHFSEVLFDDVHLDEDALIGVEGNGWQQVNAELAFERSGPERLYSSIVLLEHWITYLRSQANSCAHEVTIGRFATHLSVLRNMSIALTTRLASGESPLVEAALVKDLGTEFEQSIPAVIEGAIGMSPDEPVSPDFYRAVVYTSLIAPTYSLRGGTREILRSIIARGLGLR